MFDSPAAKAVAYGGILALVLGAVAVQVVSPPLPAPVQARDSRAAPMATAAPRAETPEPPPGEVIRPGTRIHMTPEQVRWPEDPPAPDAAPAPPARHVPYPRPLSERPPAPAASAPSPVPAPQPGTVAPVVRGDPPRPLGTLPSGHVPQPPSAIETLRGWQGGDLDDYLRGRAPQPPVAGPVPPAPVGP